MCEVVGVENWLQSLDPPSCESVFAAMRTIGSKADSAIQEHNKLRTPYGRIGIGSAQMDPFFKAESLYEFLRELRRGSDPSKAHELAAEFSRQMVRKWNSNPTGAVVWGKHELHRDHNTCEPYLTWALILVTEAANEDRRSQADDGRQGREASSSKDQEAHAGHVRGACEAAEDAA